MVLFDMGIGASIGFLEEQQPIWGIILNNYISR